MNPFPFVPLTESEPCSYCLGAPWCPGEAECGAELDQPEGTK